MKKIIMSSIAALSIAATLSAGTINTDQYDFAPAKTSIGCSIIIATYVDTSQDAFALASIQKTKINDASAAKVDYGKAPIKIALDSSTETHALYAEHRGDILLPLIAHRFGSEKIKIAAITDYGRNKFEVGWTEGQSKIDSKQSV